MQSPRPAERTSNDASPSLLRNAWTEKDHPYMSWVFPFRYAAIIGSLLFVSFVAIIIVLGDNTEAQMVFTDIASFMINGLVTIALFFGALKSRLIGRQVYIAWMMIAASQLAFTIGDALWTYTEMVLHENPFPALSDYFYLISYPLFLVGIMLLPSMKFTSTERLKRMLDTAIVITAAILFFWSFIIAPTLEQNQGTDILALTLSVAYPVMDLVLLLALIELLLKRIYLPGPNPLLFLAGGIIVLIIADALFFQQTVHGTYASAGIVDIGYILGYILIGLAGMAQADPTFRGTFRNKSPNQPHCGLMTWPLYLPYLCAAGAFILLVQSMREPTGPSNSALSWAVAGIIGMLIARQVLALSENAQLYSKAQREINERRGAEHEIKRLNEMLERRVRERACEFETANKDLQSEIAERKQIENALNDSKRRLGDIINFLPDATFVIDREGRVIAWNKAIESLTGVKAEDILGKGDCEYSLPFYGERRPILIDLVMKADHLMEKKYNNIKRQQDGTLIGEAYMPSLNGGETYLVGSAAALFDSVGNISGAIESMRDITDRKHAEEDLQRAKEKAESATKAKSEFLSNMSHEIRTPMNAVIGLTGLFLETEMTPVQRDYVETIRNSGDALLAIINNILDFSKIDGGQMVLESQPFNLRSCVEESLDLVAARAAQKGLELVYFIEDRVPEIIVGDVTRLRQILVNLLGNAVKFTEKGEVMVSVDSSPLEKGRVEILISVKDTGIGISEEHMGSLFQSFSQVDSSTTRNYGGTGLGLAISKRLVELMGGSITVESELGRGSTFRFTVAAEVFGSKEHAHLKDITLTGKRLIIVDDNETSRLMLMEHARLWGMEVTEAASGHDALNMLEDGRAFDAALIDSVMPDMRGIDLAGKLKERKNGGILIILLIPFGLSKVQDPLLAGVLTKPVKPLKLHKLLVDLLSPPVSGQTDKKTSQGPSVEDHVHSLRILLAEDNAVNQKVALGMLQSLGYKADVAANGIEVLETMERRHYDVVLMDVQMPEMDGYEATCCIRKRESSENQPWIIAMTAYALEGDKEECFKAGMNEYIRKPIKITELQEALDRRRQVVKGKAR